MPVNKLILIGFMGSGKSSVAPLLAQRLNFRAVDADRELVRASGYESIAEIFSHAGEPEFRDLEAKCIAALRDASSVVIATGGGVIGREENMQHLSCNGGVIVFLDTSFAEVTRRIGDLASRPLFRNQSIAEMIYQQRLPVYRRYADYTVHTDGKSPDELCTEITTLLEEYR
jgi:shikimate kinase